MRIILDVQFLSNEHRHGSSQHLLETVTEMARRYSDDQFIFLTHEPGKTIPHLPPNIQIKHIKKGLVKWLGGRWWYKYILPKQLKKLGPALFVAADNFYIPKMAMPTCLFVIQLNSLLEQPTTTTKAGKAHKQLLRSLKEVTAVVTFSKYSSQMIQKQAFISKEKIKLLEYAPGGPASSFTWAEKESIKVQYAAGCEYFVFAGDLDPRFDLLGLLKAFSQFKKRMQSNMQLVLAGNKTAWAGEFTEKLSTFKFRSDVHVIADPSVAVLHNIIGAAYAFVYPALFDYFSVNIILAMKAGVPVIASAIPVIQEIAGTAVLYPDTNDESGFAKALQEIYKDENLSNHIIETAKNHLLAAGKKDIVEDCRIFFEAVFTSKS